MQHSEDQCPFCQQPVGEELSKQLSNYFDATFKEDMDALERLGQRFKEHHERIVNAIDSSRGVLEREPGHEQLLAELQVFERNLNENLERIEQKQREPSQPVELVPFDELFQKLNTSVGLFNEAVDTHNVLVDDFDQERERLSREVWRFLASEAKDEIREHTRELSSLTKAVGSIEQKIEAREQEQRATRAKLRKLNRSITSIEPTIAEINALLQSCGFQGFSLTQAEEDGYYTLKRPGGEDAMQDLSEGERTFIAFLYFYHLIEGGSSEEDGFERRVVVFDDPVSSLDGDVLFVVSTLIRNVLNRTEDASSRVQQVFVLTHNVYFHNEVCFNRSKKSLPDRRFFVVRRPDACSVVTDHQSENPIKTTYQLLWQELKESERAVTLQNTMRRILEAYFKILGGLDLDKIVEHFEGRERQVVGSLISWVNGGSHSPHDELNVDIGQESTDVYREVFRRIFEHEEHGAHYEMMMNGYSV